MSGMFGAAAVRIAAVLLAATLLLFPATPSFAQRDGFPPGGIPGGGNTDRSSGQDSAGSLVRIDQLESRVRSMTGQIEQLQFQLRRMQKQLEAFQKDVDFRFKEGAPSSGGSGRSQQRPERRGDIQGPDNTADAETGAQRQPAPQPVPAAAPATAPVRTARGGRDVFDPAVNPDAPGAPVQLGSPSNLPSAPLIRGPLTRGPLDGNARDDGLPAPDSPINLSRAPDSLRGNPLPPPSSGNAPAGAGGQSAALRPAALPQDASPKQVYRAALTAMRNGRPDDAERDFKTFLTQFPKSSLSASVQYNLGVIFASRSRHREAAEQFLKVSTDYRKSSVAPDSLYRLGLSLERLGAREQACASYAEVERRYPLAPGSLRVRVERQMKKTKC